MTPVTAVLADDEPLLLESLQRTLATVWPELHVCATASNGDDALQAVLEHKPSVVFLDIQMPGPSGLDVAQAIAEDWPPDNNSPPPLVVFATAFDQYAVSAFEKAAVDYLLKPIKTDRLEHTVSRLQKRLQGLSSDSAEDGAKVVDRQVQALSDQLRRLINASADAADPPAKRLKVIRASAGNTVRVLPIDDVILFESADKYVTVYADEGEFLIRESLKKLLLQLDPEQFQQIHRSAVVNLGKIHSAVREESGKLTLQLVGTDKQPVVSRVYRHQFQAM